MPGDLRKAGLSSGTSYYVRAKYRGEVPGEKVEVKTYEALSIPNSDLMLDMMLHIPRVRIHYTHLKAIGLVREIL